jgi:chaperonin GroES
MASKIRPLGDRILLERIEEDEQKSAGGIIIPDTAKEKSTEGTILAVGAGRRLDDGQILPMNVKVGDRVLYGKYGGTEIAVDGKDYVILTEDDVIGIVE